MIIHLKLGVHMATRDVTLLIVIGDQVITLLSTDYFSKCNDIKSACFLPKIQDFHNFIEYT